MLASILSVAHTIGYPALFLLVMMEAGGAPVPGETALITGAVVANQGRLEIGIVIALAATAAIIGDNIGYVIGRKGGRWLLERPGWFERHRRRTLEIGEPFFDRHGPKAVFFGRWILGLRVWASWLAGATRMRWPSFLFWNAAGGISWAVTVGLIAYAVGASAEGALSTFGLFAVVAVVVVVGGGIILQQRRRRATLAAVAGRREPKPADREQDAA